METAKRKGRSAFFFLLSPFGHSLFFSFAFFAFACSTLYWCDSLLAKGKPLPTHLITCFPKKKWPKVACAMLHGFSQRLHMVENKNNELAKTKISKLHFLFSPFCHLLFFFVCPLYFRLFCFRSLDVILRSPEANHCFQKWFQRGFHKGCTYMHKSCIRFTRVAHSCSPLAFPSVFSLGDKYNGRMRNRWKRNFSYVFAFFVSFPLFDVRSFCRSLYVFAFLHSLFLLCPSDVCDISLSRGRQTIIKIFVPLFSQRGTRLHMQQRFHSAKNKKSEWQNGGAKRKVLNSPFCHSLFLSLALYAFAFFAFTLFMWYFALKGLNTVFPTKLQGCTYDCHKGFHKSCIRCTRVSPGFPGDSQVFMTYLGWYLFLCLVACRLLPWLLQATSSLENISD